MMDNHREAFKEEAHELLTELETALLDLERTPSDEEIIGRVFRAMHTIKGSGAIFGFDRVAAFTHDVETVYDRVRNGKITVTKPLIDLTLSACDEILKMIDDTGQGEAEDQSITDRITKSFRDMLLAPKTPSAAETDAETDAKTETETGQAVVDAPEAPEMNGREVT